MIELGQAVKDTITEYRGLVDARTEFLHGCARCRVISFQQQNGQPVEFWFDEGRLEPIEVKSIGIGYTREDG